MGGWGGVGVWGTRGTKARTGSGVDFRWRKQHAPPAGRRAVRSVAKMCLRTHVGIITVTIIMMIIMLITITTIIEPDNRDRTILPRCLFVCSGGPRAEGLGVLRVLRAVRVGDGGAAAMPAGVRAQLHTHVRAHT